MSDDAAPRDPSATKRVLSAGRPSGSSIATVNEPDSGARHAMGASIAPPGGTAYSAAAASCPS